MIRPPAEAAAVARAGSGSGIRLPDELWALDAITDGRHPSFLR